MYLEVVLWEGVRSDSSEYSLWVDDVRDDMGGISAAMPGRVTDSVGVGGISAAPASRRPGSAGANSSVVEVYLALFAGSQSDRKGAEEKGLFYVGLDTDVSVYSHARRSKVTNEYCDIPNTSVKDIVSIVKKVVWSAYGDGTDFVIDHVGASPCCKTFSRADRINFLRGMGYRDHRKAHRPPLKPKGRKTSTAYKTQSVKYKRAVDADECVVDLIRKIRSFGELYKGCSYHIENPADGLIYQKWMSELGDPVEVDYCAYGHMYQKTTHFWTDIQWCPVGSTGNGRCNNGECKMGPPKPKGKFRHWNSLCQASRMELKGKGRKARRIMIPSQLFDEMLAAR